MVSAPRKPKRVATQGRLEIRVTVDSHMGAVYSTLLAIPSRMRGRELLAMARERLALDGGPPLARATTAAAALVHAPTVVTLHPASGSEEGRSLPPGLEHLTSFAAATPPLR